MTGRGLPPHRYGFKVLTVSRTTAVCSAILLAGCNPNGESGSPRTADLSACYQVSLTPHLLDPDSIRAYADNGGRPDWFFEANDFMMRLDRDSLTTPFLRGLRVSFPATSSELSAMHPVIWEAVTPESLDIHWWDGYDGIALFLVREEGWEGYSFFTDDYGCVNREGLPGCWRADAEAEPVACPDVDWAAPGDTASSSH